MEFAEGEAVVIVSASLDNSYLVFGFKETQSTISRSVDKVEVLAIESTSLAPKFSIYPPGVRNYYIKDWEEFGCESSAQILDYNDDFMRLASDSVL
jgi:hypothetical protein